MDPYENGNEPPGSDQQLSYLSMITAFEVLKNIVHPPHPRYHAEDVLRDVSPSRSQRIAQFVRDRPRLPRLAKFGLAVFGLVAVIGTTLRRRAKR